ncbi:MAG: hypothetical protein IKP77_03535 [Acholeplasmatales bacterium]|nr:hypothetical protein [Acholeplasmatales bacterium]
MMFIEDFIEAFKESIRVTFNICEKKEFEFALSYSYEDVNYIVLNPRNSNDKVLIIGVRENGLISVSIFDGNAKDIHSYFDLKNIIKIKEYDCNYTFEYNDFGYAVLETIDKDDKILVISVSKYGFINIYPLENIVEDIKNKINLVNKIIGYLKFDKEEDVKV